jgi:hypothetical protein
VRISIPIIVEEFSPKKLLFSLNSLDKFFCVFLRDEWFGSGQL